MSKNLTGRLNISQTISQNGEFIQLSSNYPPTSILSASASFPNMEMEVNMCDHLKPIENSFTPKPQPLPLPLPLPQTQTQTQTRTTRERIRKIQREKYINDSNDKKLNDNVSEWQNRLFIYLSQLPINPMWTNLEINHNSQIIYIDLLPGISFIRSIHTDEEALAGIQDEYEDFVQHQLTSIYELQEYYGAPYQIHLIQKPHTLPFTIVRSLLAIDPDFDIGHWVYDDYHNLIRSDRIDILKLLSTYTATDSSLNNYLIQALLEANDQKSEQLVKTSTWRWFLDLLTNNEYTLTPDQLKLMLKSASEKRSSEIITYMVMNMNVSPIIPDLPKLLNVAWDLKLYDVIHKLIGKKQKQQQQITSRL